MAGVDDPAGRAARRDLKRFVKLPFRLHRDHPQWVPPLIFERPQFLNRKKNPFFEHAEAEYFLAERDGEPVGRITAQVDAAGTSSRAATTGCSASSRLRGRPGGRRGAARRRRASGCAARGRERMLGPMDFTTNDEIGILIEGYDAADDPRALAPALLPASCSRRRASARRWTC